MRCNQCKLVGKANTEFNFQINNYREDILQLNTIQIKIIISTLVQSSQIMGKRLDKNIQNS